MNKFFKRCLCSLVIVAVLFWGGASLVVALENTSFSANKIVFDNFNWSIEDKLTLSSPQLIVTPANSSMLVVPGAFDVIAQWLQESTATCMGFKIALAPGQLAIKYETNKFLAIDAKEGLTGEISGRCDIFGPVGVCLNGNIIFHGDVYLDFVDSTLSKGQGQIEFPIRLSVPLPGFGHCFAYSNATADLSYQESVITASNIFLKNNFTTVTGEVALNLDTDQARVSLDITSDSDLVKFLMSAVVHFSGVTKLGSGHWKYEFAN